MEDSSVQRYVERGGAEVVTIGALSTYMITLFGPDYPLVNIAKSFETNSKMRSDVLIAMAGRNGIYIPPQNYGDVRGNYNPIDGQYVIREYSRRLREVADKCASLRIPDYVVTSWLRATPDDVAGLVRTNGISVDSSEIDEENEYYLDRLALYSLLSK
jgi:hypothetical protein